MGTIVRMIFAASLLLLPAAVPASAFPDGVPGDGGAVSKALPPAAKNPEDPVPRELRWKNAAVIGGIAFSVGIYGANSWWKEGLSGSFRTIDEGWFGQNSYAGGADKAGHAFFTYTGARLLARGFEALGNEPGRALRLGVWTSFGVMSGVEVVDGFSKRFRFSMEDAVANASGAAFAVLLEKYPDLDGLVDFRLLYRRSADARRVGETDPIADYSGQLFLFAFKADGVPAFRDLPVARYLELQVGYNTHGYEPNDGVKIDPHRRIYYGVGINLSRLLGDTVFRGDLKDGRIQRGADTVLEFLQVPGTAAQTYRRL
ncbi:MAG: DUF2279 domain-containing protein [Candidatus Deferrimicrobiaceae bacterium]